MSHPNSTSITPESHATRKKLPLEVLRKLPKAELHCHLDGSVRISTIIQLAKEQGVQLPTFDEEELRKLVSVDDNCQSLVEYLRGFDIALSVMQRKYAISRIMYEVCEDAAKDGVKYIEVRFSPILHTKEGLSLSSVMEAILEGRTKAEIKFNMHARVIVSAMRQLDSSVTKKLAELAWRYRNKGVAAFDLAGPEDGFSSVLHKEAFELIHQKMFNCTLHSGEAASWESVLDSVRYCGAQRIGHGVRMRENQELIEWVSSNRIPIEVCLTSNVHTKCIANINDHPIREFFDKGVVVVPCTDNRTVSNITLSEEYYKIQEHYGFTILEIARLIDLGFRSAFIDLDLKTRLRDEAMTTFFAVLEEEGYEVESVKRNFFLEYDFPVLFSGLSHLNSSRLYTEQEGTLNKLLKMVPKADPHCNFNSSISVDTLWKNFVEEDRSTWALDFELLGMKVPETKQDLINILQPSSGHTMTSFRKAVDIMALLLQTPAQIERGLEDIYYNAVEENVCYLELFVRPTLHVRRQLSEERVLQIILKKKAELEKTYPSIAVNLVLYVNREDDGVFQMKEVSLIAIKYRSQVAGFGIFGYETDMKTMSSSFMDVISLLKNHKMDIIMDAGFEDCSSVVTALTDGGATRLSGCFSIHNTPETLAYLCDNTVPVEIGCTLQAKLFVKGINYTDNLTRLFVDSGLRVGLCSTDMTLNGHSRTEALCKISKESKLSLHEIAKLVSGASRLALDAYKQRKACFRRILSDFEKLVNQEEFKGLLMYK